MPPTPQDHDAPPVGRRTAGSGPVALFLHGLGGSRTAWDPQLTHLADLRTCVAWDMPGYGVSSGSPTSFAAVADVAAALARELSDEPVDVVGLSLGGMVAQHLALDHPDVVRSLVLLDTSPAFGLDGTTTARSWLDARLAPLDAGQTPAEMAPAVVAAVAGPAMPEAGRTAAVAAMARVPAAALRAACAMLVTHDTRARLAEVACPTLVVVGEHDEETPLPYAEAIAALVPGARLEVVPGAGHLVNLERPDLVNEIVRTFWEGLHT